MPHCYGDPMVSNAAQKTPFSDDIYVTKFCKWGVALPLPAGFFSTVLRGLMIGGSHE